MAYCEFFLGKRGSYVYLESHGISQGSNRRSNLHGGLGTSANSPVFHWSTSWTTSRPPLTPANSRSWNKHCLQQYQWQRCIESRKSVLDLHRSRPVFCHFCRSRKLKCNRQFPCSNCTSRDKTCQLYPSTNLPVGPRHQASQLPSNDNTDVLARLRRLEEIVIINGPASSPLGQDNTQALSLPSLLAPTPRQSCVVQEEQSSANGYDLVGSRDHIVRLTGRPTLIEPNYGK